MPFKKLVLISSTLLVVALLILRWDALATASASVSASMGLVAGAPFGYDPLTAAEMETVVTAGAAVNPARAGTTRQELLLVERHDGGKAKGNPPRQGDLYLYDYATDTLIHSTVDVASGAVTAVEYLQGVQLPLNANEEQRALDLIQADAQIWAQLARRYGQIVGEPLTQIEQLQVKVSVFHADTMPERLNAAAQQCGRHRCAQVLLFTVDKTLLELMPIVDLSQGQVAQTLNSVE